MEPVYMPTTLISLIILIVTLVHTSGDYLGDYIDNYESNHALSRHRRAVGDDYASYMPENATVDEVEFHLFKVGGYEDVVEMTPGSKVEFLLLVHLPAGTSDLLVELFTPDNDTTVMIICNPRIHSKGSNLEYDAAQAQPVMDARDGGTQFDRAVINFGNVTNSGDGLDSINNIIQITWEAVMIENDDTVDGGEYRVSAGAEYNNENDIWIGQCIFTVNTSDWEPSTNNSFNFSGPREVEIGKSYEFVLDMYLPDITTEINVDAFAPFNETSDQMSICGLAVTSVGDGYGCNFRDNRNGRDWPVDALRKSVTGLTDYYGRIELGQLINGRAREELFNATEDDHMIQVKFSAKMTDDASLIGQEFLVGAAVEVGLSQIWAGSYQVTAIAKTHNYTMDAEPVFSLLPVGNFTPGMTELAIGHSLNMELTMMIPVGSDSNYRFEMNMPFEDDLPRFRICQVNIKKVGRNLPCLGTGTKAELISTQENDITDRAVWDLGCLRNSGLVPESDVPGVNDFVMSLTVVALNHTANEEGAEVPLPVGVMYVENERIWADYINVTIVAQPTDQVVAYPVANLTFEDFGDNADHMYIGESRKVDLRMCFTPGTTYGPMTLELLTSVNNSVAMLSICDAQLTIVDEGIGCFDKISHNKKFQKHSSSDDGKNDRYVLPMDSIDSLDTADDSCLIVSSYVRLDDVEDSATGEVEWVGAGIIFGDERIWVTSMDVTVQTEDSDKPTLSEVPYIFTNRSDDVGLDIGIGMPFTYEIIIKIPPMQSTHLSIEAIVTSPLSVCDVRVMEYGKNLPCGRTDIKPVFAPGADGTSLTGSIDLGVVTNLGNQSGYHNTFSEDVFDDNSIRVRLIGKLAESGTSGDSAGTLDITVNYRLDGIDRDPDIATETFNTIATPAISTSNDSITVNMYRAAISSNTSDLESSEELAKGETAIMRMDIDFSNEAAIANMQVKFLAPVNESGLLQICDINVIHMGQNFPCSSKKAYLSTQEFISRDGSDYIDYGGIDLGHICFWPDIAETAEDAENKITVEAVVRLTRNNRLSEGEPVLLSSTLKVNDQLIFVEQCSFTVRDTHDLDISNEVYNDKSGTFRGIADKARNLLLGLRPSALKTHIPSPPSWASSIIHKILGISDKKDKTEKEKPKTVPLLKII